MSVLEITYFVCSGLLWFLLATMVILLWRKGFMIWLLNNKQLRFYLLGVEDLPDQPEELIRKFYTYLFVGWTWILLWAWWLMPELKTYFFRSITNELTLKVARISTLVVVISYAAVGFFAIAKAMTIWYRKLYRPSLAVKTKDNSQGN